MIRVARSALVPYRADRMYAIVADVHAYPKFLPWCRNVEVTEQSATETRATLHLDYHGIRQRFTTRNTHDAPRSIDLDLVDGPFRHLDGLWVFADLGPAGSKVELTLSYEFASLVLERVVGPAFNHIANSLIAAFIRRADQLARQEPGSATGAR